MMPAHGDLKSHHRHLEVGVRPDNSPQPYLRHYAAQLARSLEPLAKSPPFTNPNIPRKVDITAGLLQRPLAL